MNEGMGEPGKCREVSRLYVVSDIDGDTNPRELKGMVNIYKYTHMHVYMCTCIHIYIYVYILIYIYIHTYTYIHTYIYVSIYIYMAETWLCEAFMEEFILVLTDRLPTAFLAILLR